MGACRYNCGWIAGTAVVLWRSGFGASSVVSIRSGMRVAFTSSQSCWCMIDKFLSLFFYAVLFVAITTVSKRRSHIHSVVSMKALPAFPLM